ncbi:Cd(II)/Pb(II)-responsive transcriptional regulator [Lonsdalea populi]|uniref:Cd(II)/Pb(II)-responsive transcriptional regulator n=1 Tax=Lonsdalea populi TaxID=1172565 RepID=A0A3N0UAC1_9GAMM|nr:MULTISPECIES: Cd(II)/Pb(II)-responsive transcriptional regulator [Lonsdalea]RAT14267.1 Cd(II)/Pb(II)-responsive transcriptional regulator [Lonsdalea quercina]RAT25997.1 Cd(II)/Pb(II)-responsive transcriptional regulator [Lonsdalea populi]RAT37439.1 Cd(II)/Pb(II)-responsive transcriptional regulator [Lonsdalea populi]RAT45747.1 Cd(II)/Pb(II)-responsive transcriptional regulator [Lonsdalea populi]RAT51238.1 Cd(II)/Pb(II)-responsive transcriptional regulator [Lonsdalea populi]
MKIGELARQAGCPVETVRYYEREGLLQAALRDPSNNYRYYNVLHLERLMFIRRCRALDMTHEEIRVLLQARSQPDADCGTVNALINEHLHHVQDRIRELNMLEKQLSELKSLCNVSRATRDCGILRELQQSEEPEDILPVITPGHLAGSHSH